MPIILHLQGGLGNQLFQYAAAKALATHHKLELVLDDSWFISTPRGLTPRQLMLNALNIPEKCSTYRKFLPRNRLLQKLILFFQGQFFSEFVCNLHVLARCKTYLRLSFFLILHTNLPSINPKAVFSFGERLSCPALSAPFARVDRSLSGPSRGFSGSVWP